MGVSGPDSKLSIYQTNSTNNTNVIQKNTTVSVIPQPEIKQNTNVTNIKEESNTPVQQNSTIQPTQDNSVPVPTQSNSMWNNIIIVLSIVAAAIMAGVIIFVKMYRSKGNAR